MNSQKGALHKDISIETFCDLVVDGLQDKKGKNIVKLDLRHLDDAPTDFFIICEGDSNTQVKALSDGVYGKVKQELGMIPTHVEGQQNSLWILVDYFDVVVHVFYHETRKYYELEELWSDALFTEYDNL